MLILGGGIYYMSRPSYGRLGRDTIVRCQQGHLFTTIWIPFISFKAIRWGFFRFQRCPIGNHMTWVTPVNPSDLTDDQRFEASQHRDTNVP
jgi:hypothetical protein